MLLYESGLAQLSGVELPMVAFDPAGGARLPCVVALCDKKAHNSTPLSLPLVIMFDCSLNHITHHLSFSFFFFCLL